VSNFLGLLINIPLAFLYHLLHRELLHPLALFAVDHVLNSAPFTFAPTLQQPFRSSSSPANAYCTTQSSMMLNSPRQRGATSMPPSQSACASAQRNRRQSIKRMNSTTANGQPQQQRCPYPATILEDDYLSTASTLTILHHRDQVLPYSGPKLCKISETCSGHNSSPMIVPTVLFSDCSLELLRAFAGVFLAKYKHFQISQS
jgi:hypothetical protein